VPRSSWASACNLEQRGGRAGVGLG
jgi:hypothetical protein